MEPQKKLSSDYSKRIDEILDTSWLILKTGFIEGRYEITTEAPFQHHFAHIISTIGGAYCTKRSDIFKVDLEKKIDYIKGKTKYLDITCGFSRGGKESQAEAAIELKFKTSKQGAQDHGRIDAFVDIEALELACNDHSFTQGRFYMITDSKTYLNESKKGVGTEFTTFNGARTQANSLFHCPDSKGRENVKVNLKSSYSFKWEKIEKIKTDKKEEWYFLELEIKKIDKIQRD